jgi:hypothetical protein
MIQVSKPSRSLMFTLLTALVAVPSVTATAFAQEATSDGLTAPAAIAEGSGAKLGRHGVPVNISGEVAKYVVGPLGHVHAVLLKDGTAVMVHDTAGDEMAKDVEVGQTVRVEGWTPQSSRGKVVRHAAVYGQHGQVVTPPSRQEMQAERANRQQREAEYRAEVDRLPAASADGTVSAVIPGRRGLPMAVVLSNGTSVFLRRSLAKAMSSRGIQVGDQIRSAGKGTTHPLGTSVVASSITFSDGAHFEASGAPAR